MTRTLLRPVGFWLCLIVANIGFSQQGGPSLFGIGPNTKPPEQKTEEKIEIRKDFKRPKAPEGGPAAFLSAATSRDLEKYSKFSDCLMLPTKEIIDEAYSDLPFAVNVPFEVPFDGGVVRVLFDVNVVWEEPEMKVTFDRPGFGKEPLISSSGGWQVYHQGIYRLENGPIAADTVVWEVDRKETRPMTWLTEAPFPVLLNGALPSPQNRGSVTTRIDINCELATAKPRKPFMRSDGRRSMFALTRPLVLRAAQPGWYSFWFTMSPTITKWPPKALRPDGTLRAKIFVHTLVARRDRYLGEGDYFNPRELDYLWEGHDVKLDRPIDPKLVRLSSMEIPVVVRRDGWVFDRVDIRRQKNNEDFLDEKLATAKPDESSAADVKGSIQGSPTGVKATYTADVYERSDRSAPFRGPPHRSTTMTWDVTLPREIPDGGVGEVVFAGSAQKQGGDASFQTRGPGWPDRVPYWFGEPRSPADDPLRIGSMIESISYVGGGDRERYINSWGWKIGDLDASRYFRGKSDYNPPKSLGEPKRYALYAAPVRADEAGDRAPLLYKDLGPQRLYSVSIGPWIVDACYRRKKDVDKSAGKRPGVGPTTIVEEKDPFWAWYPENSRFLKAKLTAAQSAMTQAAPIGISIKDHEDRARSLLRAVQAQAELGQGDSVFRSGETLATVSEKTFGRMLAEARILTAAARDDRKFASEKMKEAMRAYTEIDEALAKANTRFIDRHPEILLWRRAYGIEKSMKRYAFAASTGDMAVFREALAESRLENVDPEVRLYEGRLLRDMGDWAAAVWSLRKVVAPPSTTGQAKDGASDTPEIKGLRNRAEAMLLDIECAILTSALQKSQGALKEARKNFYRYMEERGFSEKSPTASDVPIPWRLPGHPLSNVTSEDAWAVFTTGVTGALTGILGKAGAEADLLDSYERQMTTAYLGLNMIIRLRQRGHTLKQIAGQGVGGNVSGGMTTDQMLKALPLRNSTGGEYTRAQALQMSLAVREALKLPEVAALVSENEGALRGALSAGYWNPNDVTDTWAEWVGDITSPKNLFINLLPMSVGTVGGVSQGVKLWSATRAEAVAAMRAVGAAESGTLVVARMVGLEQGLLALRATDSGARLATVAARICERYDQLGFIDKVIWQGGKFVSLMALQGMVAHGLEQLAGKEGALAAEMIFIFATDEDVLIKFAYGNGVNPSVLARLLDEGFVAKLKTHVKDLDSIKEQTGVINKLIADLRAGTPSAKMDPDVKQIVFQPLLTGPSVEAIPNGNAGHDSKIALKALAEGVENNTDTGAGHAVITLAPDVNDEIATAGADLAKAQKLSEKLKNAPAVRSTKKRPRPTDLEIPKTDEQVAVKMPPQPKPGSAWASAKTAMSEGRFDDAEKIWVDLIQEYFEAAKAGRALTKHELPLEILEMELHACRARGAPARPAGSGALTANKILTGEEAEAAIARAQGRRNARLRDTPTDAPDVPAPAPGAAVGKGSSGRVDIADDFVVKELEIRPNTLTPNWMRLQAQAEGEVVGAQLQKALGGKSAGVHVKVLEWGPGDPPTPKRLAIVSRTVDGALVSELSPEQIFALRQEMARHRVLSILIGDYDRKLDNYKLSSSCDLFPIDAGQGDIRGRIAESLSGMVDDPMFTEGFWGRDHWYRGSFIQHEQGKAANNAEFMNKVFFAEHMLTYDDAVPALREVTKLMSQDGKLMKEELTAAYTQLYKGTPLEGKIDEFVREAFGAISERAEKLDDVVRGFNLRNGVPIKTPRPSRTLWWRQNLGSQPTLLAA